MDKARSLLTLIPKLLVATASKKLKWSKHQAGYSVAIGEITISVWTWSDMNSPETSGASTQLSKGGVVLDELISDEYDPNYRVVRDLYLAARRSALDVDNVIADIEQRIDLL